MTTDLQKKLGLTEQTHGLVLHEPDSYAKLLPDIYPVLSHKLVGEFDWIHAFYTDKDGLLKELPLLKRHLSPHGQLWLSWPKKSSPLASELSDEVVRKSGLTSGLVDVKVAAIDDNWSGLMFIYRSATIDSSSS